MNIKKLPIGISDFKEVITGDYYYVDKTLLIQEIIDSDDKILLLPRPRRFGKTLNISMLRYFYDCCPEKWGPEAKLPTPVKNNPPQNTYKELFNGLAIGQTGQKYMAKLGKYPVIYLSLKDIKDDTWESCFESLKMLVQEEYSRHYYLLQSQKLMPHEKEYYQKILDLTGTLSDYTHSLEKLLIFLSRYYDERVVILIDEYDAPVHTGFANGYYKEIINFIRIFLGGGLKDKDQYLEKGVLTGIMRIAKESIFSDLNNLGVFTLLALEFNRHFGFTEPEVQQMLEDFQVADMMDHVQVWYNGYRFGGRVIFNPWSIINFLRSEAKKFKPYWLNTSDNKIVETLLTKGGKELKEELEQLVRGETIEKAIEENILLRDIEHREDLLWSFLLMGGYLKQTNEHQHPASGKFIYSLSIPNEEVKFTYISIIDNFFATKISEKKLETMLKALINGEVALFEQILKMVVLAVFSYHDFGSEPEKVYHALVAGLLIWITDTHEVKSNRESGYGRYDILIIPKDASKIGYVIEFKAVDFYNHETVEGALESALTQIETKKYETELIERGISHIKKLAIAFSGKEVFVKEKKEC